MDEQALVETLAFLTVRPDGDGDGRWVGETPAWFGEYLFGGFVVAQAIIAATRNPPSGSRLAEISTRGNVQPGDQLLIGGFIVANGAIKVLLRAIGPELTAFKVPSPLQNPTLELRDDNGALLEANDDWKTDNRQAISDTGMPPKDDRESAIVRTVNPGHYTALVRGKDNTTGIALVEIYRLP